MRRRLLTAVALIAASLLVGLVAWPSPPKSLERQEARSERDADARGRDRGHRPRGETESAERGGEEFEGGPPQVDNEHRFYFHGTQQDQANKLTGPPYTATFDGNAPTGTDQIVQSGVAPVGDPLPAPTPDDPTSMFWVAPFHGSINDTIELRVWMSEPNPEALLFDAESDIYVWADPDLTAHTATLMGSTLGSFVASPTPHLVVFDVPVSGSVTGNLLVQIIPHFTDGDQGQSVLYGSTDFPSGFVYPAPVKPPAPAGPPVQFAADQPVSFGPATIVNAHLLGGEPQTSMERPTESTPPGALDPKRIFVDWPFDGQATSLFNRSVDGGDSFRMLIDPACASRNRPNCQTGGGGDSESEVNPFTGEVYFGDQEATAQEAIASSVDHGDSFPPERQFAVTNPSGVDRQWLAAADPTIANVAGQPLHAFYAYHTPGVGEYILGITDQGTPLPQPAPQLQNVGQSGQARIDNTTGPGRGWLYVPYRDLTGTLIVATGDSRSYQSPAAWQSNVVTSDKTATIFPWLSLDSHGNAYLVFVDGAAVWYSFSAIADPANDPGQGGRPGTKWSIPTKINPPTIGSTIFPEVIAGDPGRVAVVFYGTQDFVGVQDNAPPDARWDPYVAVLTNGLAEGGQPITARVGRVSHRIAHTGDVCTSGTACAAPDPTDPTAHDKDRSMLDMVDLGIDSDGRIGVVFQDNNSAYHVPTDPADPRNSPFIHYAKQTTGPSLFGAAPINVSIPNNRRSDAAGDATWPNHAGAANLPALDTLGASLYLDGTDLVARIPLAEGSNAAMQRDLSAYNAANGVAAPAERVDYILRFLTGPTASVNGKAGDVFHMSFEELADGTERSFGGRIDDNDQILTDPVIGYALAVGYHTDAGYHVTASRDGNTLVVRAPAADYGLHAGDTVYSVTALTTAGPSEDNDFSYLNPMRTVDATPPFDAKIEAAPAGPTAVLDVTPASGDVPLVTTVDSSASSAGGSPIVSRTYDFGDGSASAATTDTSVAHTYTAIGTYMAKVTVTDSLSQTSVATQVVKVRGAPGAALIATPSAGSVPLKVTLDASGSNPGTTADDAPSKITGYDFTFGDGKTAHTTTPTVAHTYERDGTYNATVVITNVDGDKATSAAVPIEVSPTPPTPTGYWMAGADGAIFNYGDALFFGSTGDLRLAHPVVAIAARPQHDGYWMTSTAGDIFAFGAASSFGSLAGQPLKSPIVGMAATASGRGYWLVAADGGVFAFGDAGFHGSMGGKPLNKPIVGMARSGSGYWLVASDGGIFAFGGAPFLGSMGGQPLNKPIVGMVGQAGSTGYWMAASDGGVFSFGAPFFGSMGGRALNQPINAVSSVLSGQGYRFVASDGGLFSFGPDAPFKGSHGGTPTTKPVVGMDGF